MLVTATEFKNNIGKYLSLVAVEEIFITKNGKRIAKLSDAAADKQSILDSLVGIAAQNPLTLDDARAERLSRQ